ncbi:MAG: diaminopimelate epimerase [Chlorobiaceae bacterium]|nr:diaminopimelate epimerase [Chlorobiaceae bacterium]
MQINFSKLSGAGNDFIVIDNRKLDIHLSQPEINALCTRRTGIGADGLILVEPSLLYDFTMKYFNADGFPGSMCGNGGRCAVYFAFIQGSPSAAHGSFSFEANNNRYDAEVTKPETVSLHMLNPQDFRYGMEIEGFACSFVNTGSPHVVIFTSDLSVVNVAEKGLAIRSNTDFFTKGTNVNFVEVTSPSGISLRTFERGVEEETLACGTGAVAAAIISRKLGKITRNSVEVKVKSGDILEVSFSETMQDITLTGPARIVYNGSFLIP